ncbi:hypothetical protein AG1IA_01732 [Rhizoctonia solani AG-1 IA]|uniref:Uncharacterized protein n=1 Tax=Thanatephorus cucumeris (strain AG1-IA) TaxID=983506 RepID=L8X6H3_THACA|nr:hypothetical protein AG1IA_01732 [Rhizoctonia solani AG-1 IA]
MRHRQLGRELGRKYFGSNRRSKHHGCPLAGGRILRAGAAGHIRKPQLMDNVSICWTKFRRDIPEGLCLATLSSIMRSNVFLALT